MAKWFSNPASEKWCEKEAKILLEWVKVPENVWLKAFAAERGYCEQRISEMCQKSPVFARARRNAMEMQRQKLLFLGLNRTYEPWLVKFILQAPQNIEAFRQPEHDKREIKVTHEGVLSEIDTEIKQMKKEDATPLEKKLS